MIECGLRRWGFVALALVLITLIGGFVGAIAGTVLVLLLQALVAWPGAALLIIGACIALTSVSSLLWGCAVVYQHRSPIRAP